MTKRCPARVSTPFSIAHPFTSRPCILKAGHDGPHKTKNGYQGRNDAGQTLPGHIDLHSLDEDARIKVMCDMARTHPGEVVGCLTDSEPEKVHRYIAKIREYLLVAIIQEPVDGPVPNVKLIKFSFPVAANN